VASTSRRLAPFDDMTNLAAPKLCPWRVGDRIETWVVADDTGHTMVVDSEMTITYGTVLLLYCT